MLNYLQIGLGGLAGAAIAAGAVFAYVTMVTIPDAREDERKIVVAEGTRKAEEAIGVIGDVAERSRATRRLCSLSGLQYNFGTGKCRQPTVSPGG